MEGNIKKNILFQITYEVLILLLPFVTSPYIAEVIGPEGIGQYSYHYSIASYFSLLCMLGIRPYATRYISRIKDNHSILNKAFSELLVIHFIISTVILLCYIAYCHIYEYDNAITTINILIVIGSLFDISWFYFGIEKFKITVTSNTIIKVLSTISVFVFVKNKTDLPVYCFIMSFAFLLTQLLLWIYIRKYVEFVKIDFFDSFKHLKPLVLLFVPSIAVSIYKILDKILLGRFNNVEQLGFFEYAEKVSSIPITIIAAFGLVLMPRISNLIAKNKDNLAIEYIAVSMKYLLCLGFGMLSIMAATCINFSVCFWGYQFFYCGVLIEYLSLTIPFMTFANIIRTQYLIPNDQDKIYVTSVILGGIVNVFSNLVLIPIYGALGTVFSTILAEITVCFWQTYKVKDKLNVISYMYSTIPFAVYSIITYVLIKISYAFLSFSWKSFSLQVLSGIFLYSSLAFYHMYKKNDPLYFMLKKYLKNI